MRVKLIEPSLEVSEITLKKWRKKIEFRYGVFGLGANWDSLSFGFRDYGSEVTDKTTLREKATP